MGLFDKKRVEGQEAQPGGGEASPEEELELLATILARTEQETAAPLPGDGGAQPPQRQTAAPQPQRKPTIQHTQRQPASTHPTGSTQQAATRQVTAPPPVGQARTRPPVRAASKPEQPVERVERSSGPGEQQLERQRDELQQQRDELLERYAELQRQQEQLRARQQELIERSPAPRGGDDADARWRKVERGFEERLAALQGEYRTLNLKMEQQIAASEAARLQLKAGLDARVAELDHQAKILTQQKATIDEQKKVIDTVNEELKRLKEMDLDAFISQEKQVLQKLAAEIKSIKASMQEAQREGEVSPEEAKLIKSGQYIKKQIGEINATFSELDERLSRVRNELVRVSTIEYKFKGIEDRLTAMQRNLENIIEVQLMDKSKEAVTYMEAGKDSVVKEIQAIFAEQKSYVDEYEKRLSNRIAEVERRLSRAATEVESHFDERLKMLKEKQKEAEEALDKKLEMDRDFTERLQTVLKAMQMK